MRIKIINQEKFAEVICKFPAIDEHSANAVIFLLQKQPTADVVEVKHGKWVVNVGMNYNKERICPVCKERIEGNHWNFCSNCGAKMDR